MRQLAAILFADMVGYTTLMQENEQLARLKRKRLKEVLETTVGRFNGKNKSSFNATKLEWQDEYFAVAIGESYLNSVRTYIDNQLTHHQKKTFEENTDTL